MTTLNFDIFARAGEAIKEFEKLRRKVDESSKGFRDFADRSAKSFAKTANSLSNISTAAAGLQGAGSIVSSLSGVLGLLPAAAAAAGGAFATLAVGTMGFAEGFKEIADSSGIAKAASGAADAAVQASRRIEGAQQSLARAVRSTKDAEDVLARAQENARDAQVELTRARERATEQLEDLKRAVSGAALDEEAAILAVERAQERLVEAGKSGTGLDLREAELGVRQAQQALEETRDRYADLKKEAAAANKAGVEGSDAVVSAQRDVADANRAVKDAQQGVADAAENVRDAQKELAQAHEDAARSAEKAAAATAGTTEKFNALSANAQSAARALVGMGGAWDGVRRSVQDALFAGAAADINRLGAVYLPVLGAGMTDVAGEFNRGGRSVASFVGESAQVSDVAALLAGTGDVVGNLADTLRPLVQILLDVATVGMEMLPGLTGGFGSAAERAAAFVRNARETGELKAWIQEGLDTLRQLGELFSNVGQIISTVFSGLNAGGDTMLDTMIRVTGSIRDMLQSAEGQAALQALGETLRTVSTVVNTVLLAAFQALAPVVVVLAPVFAELARQVGELLVNSLHAVSPMLMALATWLAMNAESVVSLAISLYAGVKAFEAITAGMRIFNAVSKANPWVMLAAATIAIVTLIITNWDKIVAAVKVALDWIAGFVKTVWDGILTGLSAAWNWLMGVARSAWEGIKNVIVDPIVAAANWIGDIVGKIIDFFVRIPGRIWEALKSVGSMIGDIFKGALNIAIDVINWFIRRANDIIRGLNIINPFDDIPSIPEIAHLAKGGPLKANQPAIVGEKGMELWVPNVSGRIIPNHKLGDYSSWSPPPNLHYEARMAAPQRDVAVSVNISGTGPSYEWINYGIRSKQIQIDAALT